MRPTTLIIAESHAIARGVAMDHKLRLFEWRAILSYHDALALRGLEGPLRKPGSPYRVLLAPLLPPRSYRDIERDLMAAGFLDANGRPATIETQTTTGGKRE